MELVMNETLTNEQIYDLRQAFSSFDHEASGFVDTKDIPAIFSTLDEAYKPMFIEDEELQRIMEQAEIEPSGQITFYQFLSMIAFKMNLTDTVEELQEAFRMFDRSNSGYINFDDLWRGMVHLGENPSKHDIEEMMREADHDADGKINFAEFVEMIRCQETANKAATTAEE